MGRMKTLPKLLLIVLVVGGFYFGIQWAIKTGWIPGGGEQHTYSSPIKVIPTTPRTVERVSPSLPQSTTARVDVKKVVSSPSLPEPITVCVVTWGGYAGGQYFNEGFSASVNSRFYTDYGILVEFKVIDDFDASRKAWMADECRALWVTVDAFPTEAGSLIEFEPKLIFQADWSRGGDAAVVTREINSVSDLKGARIALLPASPSHTFLLHMLEAGGLEPADVELVTAQSAPDAAMIFKSGSVKAAIVWSPDDEDAVRNVPGSKIFKSTREASNIIPDGFYVKKAYLDSNKPALKAFVEGWLRGAAEINSNPMAKEKAVKILSQGLNISETDAARAINNARLTTYGDNVNFFNLNGNYSGVKGEDIYTRMTRVYGGLGLAKNVPGWRTITDTTILREIQLVGSEHAAEGGPIFSAPTAKEVYAPAYATKRISVTFSTGSAVLDDNAKTVIDVGFASVAKAFATSRIRIEGNTDITGSEEKNMVLSKRRAQAVADYLVGQYQFDRNRFVVVGNGQSKPVADNAMPEGRAKNRRTDFELLN